MPEFRNNSEYKGGLRKRLMGIVKGSEEIHHWNYNNIYSVIILDRSLHRRVHQKMKLDSKSLCYKNQDGELMDSAQKHISFIEKIANDFRFISDVREL